MQHWLGPPLTSLALSTGFSAADDDALAASSHYSPAQPILDIDADANLLSCPEYVKEIFQHLQEAEVCYPLPAAL